MISVKNGSEYGKTWNLNSLLLLLDNIDEALGDSTPHMIKQPHGLSLGGFLRRAVKGLGLISTTLILLIGVTNELQVQLRESFVKGARIVHTLLD